MPSKPARGSIYKDDSYVSSEYKANKYVQLLQHPIVTNWGWLIAFSVICIFNGFLLKQAFINGTARLSNIPYIHIALAVYMAIFPLTASIYNVFKKTWVFISFLLISRVILAFAIFQLYLPSISIPSIFLYTAASLLFAFILIDIASDRGMSLSTTTFFLVSVAVLTSILFRNRGLKVLEEIFRIIWYCNLVVAVNKSATKLRVYLNNFDSALLTVTANAAIALSIGWFLGSIV